MAIGEGRLGGRDELVQFAEVECGRLEDIDLVLSRMGWGRNMELDSPPPGFNRLQTKRSRELEHTPRWDVVGQGSSVRALGADVDGAGPERDDAEVGTRFFEEDNLPGHLIIDPHVEGATGV